MLFILLFAALTLLFLLFINRNYQSAIGLVVVLYLIDQFLESKSTFFSNNSQIVNIVVLTLLTFGALKSFKKSGLPRGFEVRNVSICCLLLVYGLISGSWSEIDGWLLERSVNSLPYMFIYMIFATFLIRSLKDAETASLTILIAGFGMVSILLLTNSLQVGGIYNPYIASNYRDTLQLNYLAVGQSVGYVALVAALGPLFTRAKWAFLVNVFICIICLYASFTSGARGQTLMLALTLIIFWPLRHGRNLSKPLIVYLIFFTLVFAFSSFYNFDGLLNLEGSRWSASLTEAGNWRYTAAIDSLQLWYSSPVLLQLVGLGSGSIKANIGYYPHVLVIEVLVEQGVLGLTILMYLLVRYYKATVNICVSTSGNKRARVASLPYAAFVLFTFGLSFKQGTLFDWSDMFLFGAIVLHLEYLNLAFKRAENRASIR